MATKHKLTPAAGLMQRSNKDGAGKARTNDGGKETAVRLAKDGGKETEVRLAASIYYAFLAVRVLMVFTPGYIHPDEFFQASEIAARDVLGADVFVPWEFGGEKISGKQLPRAQYPDDVPCRSISFPAVACHLPLWAANVTAGIMSGGAADLLASCPWMVIVVPRLWAVVLSWLNDCAIAAVACHLHVSPWPVLAVWSTSWTVFLIYSRNFSNVYEALWVSAALYTALSRLRPVAKSVCFGVITALGAFCRFVPLADNGTG